MPFDVGYNKSPLKNSNTTINANRTQNNVNIVNKSQDLLNKKHKNFRMYLHTNSLEKRNGFFS
jgi:hypothetical protein